LIFVILLSNSFFLRASSTLLSFSATLIFFLRISFSSFTPYKVLLIPWMASSSCLALSSSPFRFSFWLVERISSFLRSYILIIDSFIYCAYFLTKLSYSFIFFWYFNSIHSTSPSFSLSFLTNSNVISD